MTYSSNYFFQKWMGITRNFPRIKKLGRPLISGTVYYPIAKLRMKLDEYSYEEFEAIERAILGFCRGGITEPGKLAGWMGIKSERFVSEHLALLKAEGLLDEKGTVTVLGESSLIDNHKIQTYDKEQIFAADGHFGFLLPRAFQALESNVRSKDSLFSPIPVLRHAESIQVENLFKEIGGDNNINKYKRYRYSVLNANVNEILDVSFQEMGYVKSILMSFEKLPGPVIFLPYRAWEENAKNRKSFYSPLFLTPEQKSKLLVGGESNDLNIPEKIDQKQLETLQSFADMISDNFKKEFLADEKGLRDIGDWLSENTAFKLNGLKAEDEIIYADLDLDLSRVKGLTYLDLELLAAASFSKKEGYAPVEITMEFNFISQKGESKKIYKNVTVNPVGNDMPWDLANYLMENWENRKKENFENYLEDNYNISYIEEKEKTNG